MLIVLTCWDARVGADGYQLWAMSKTSTEPKLLQQNLMCFFYDFLIAFFTEVYVSSPPQVNLSQCTKPVEPGLRPLCDQSMYLSESPASSYKKTLCCDSCKRKSSHLRLYVGLGGAGAFILLLSLVAVIAFRWVAARSPVRRMKEGAPLVLLIVRFTIDVSAISVAMTGQEGNTISRNVCAVQ